MVWKIIIEILVLWALYAGYMAVIVGKRGPLGGLFFYPWEVQDRALRLGLITADELKKRKRFAYILLLALMLIVPMIMVLFVNGARSYFDCTWQFYVLFLGAEFFDWLFIDTIWVALSDWWLIPGAEDLEPMWHTPKAKAWKMPKLVFLAMPLAVIVGAVYWATGLLLK